MFSIRDVLFRFGPTFASTLRASPDRFGGDIDRCRKRQGSELEARVYSYADKLIVSSVAGIAEVGDPTVLPADVASDDLGRVVWDHLLQFERRTPPLDRRTKLRDWGAFQASGAKSGRHFEENSWMAVVETKNTALLVNARPRKSLHSEMSVQVTAGFAHECIGERLKRALKAAAALREAGWV
jgi:hypothetical protein